jgi:GDP-L-fucose synthase
MKLYIAGRFGMVGSALSRLGKTHGYEIKGKSSQDLDLRDRLAVFKELESEKPDALVIAAAKVGGIGANSSYPVDFLSFNLQIQTNLIDAAHAVGIDRVLFLGSSCIYPKFALQPIRESALLTGELEPTNEPLAIAKIAGIKLISAYRKQYDRKWFSVMPSNLYGPGDNFNLENAHVLPSLISKIFTAHSERAEFVEIWGDGTPKREFLHVNDMAEACLVLLDKYDDDLPINVGYGSEISILELANMISDVIGFQGEVKTNPNFPNGTPRKIMDSSRIAALGWKPRINLRDGITDTIQWFQSHVNNSKLRV